MPVVVPSRDMEDQRWFKELHTVKSASWSYEQEVRFIYIGKTDLARKIRPEVFKKVILGCRMSPEDRQEIMEVVKTQLPKTEIWQAKPSPDRFELELNKLP